MRPRGSAAFCAGLKGGIGISLGTFRRLWARRAEAASRQNSGSQSRSRRIERLFLSPALCRQLARRLGPFAHYGPPAPLTRLGHLRGLARQTASLAAADERASLRSKSDQIAAQSRTARRVSRRLSPSGVSRARRDRGDVARKPSVLGPKRLRCVGGQACDGRLAVTDAGP